MKNEIKCGWVEVEVLSNARIRGSGSAIMTGDASHASRVSSGERDFSEEDFHRVNAAPHLDGRSRSRLLRRATYT